MEIRSTFKKNFFLRVRCEYTSQASCEKFKVRREFHSLILNFLFTFLPRIQLKIEEKTRLEFVKILKLRSNKEGDPNCDLDPRDKTAKPNENTYGMVFNPTEEKQKELAYFFGMPEDEGFNGQIIIQYEVERNYTGGEVRFRFLFKIFLKILF